MASDSENGPENHEPENLNTSKAHEDESESGEEHGAASAPKAAVEERPKHASTGGAKRSRARDEDEYEDDYDEEEEEERARRRAAARRAKARQQGHRSRGPRRKLNVPKTEEELNIPKKQTIGMLGSVSVLMIIMWFAAKLACNAHPDQIRDPRYVSVDQLARDPKNAALEFQLRLMSKDYLLAGEIATGKQADTIHDLLTFCESNADACEKERLALKDKVTATAALMEMSPTRATVEVTTYTNNENPKTVTLDVVPVGQVWKVSQSKEGGRMPTNTGAAPTMEQVQPSTPPSAAVQGE